MQTALRIENYMAGVVPGAVCFVIDALPGTEATSGELEAELVDCALSVQGRRVSFFKSGQEACWLDCDQAPLLEKLASVPAAVLIEACGKDVVRTTIMPIRR